MEFITMCYLFQQVGKVTILCRSIGLERIYDAASNTDATSSNRVDIVKADCGLG